MNNVVKRAELKREIESICFDEEIAYGITKQLIDSVDGVNYVAVGTMVCNFTEPDSNLTIRCCCPVTLAGFYDADQLRWVKRFTSLDSFTSEFDRRFEKFALSKLSDNDLVGYIVVED
jgi:hypothetical protein